MGLIACCGVGPCAARGVYCLWWLPPTLAMAEREAAGGEGDGVVELRHSGEETRLRVGRGVSVGWLVLVARRARS